MARTLRYRELSARLAAATTPTVTFSFAELEAMVGGLPRSARLHDSWWGPADDTHSQARAWMGVGYRVSKRSTASVTCAHTVRRVGGLELIGRAQAEEDVTGRLMLRRGRVVAVGGAAFLMDAFEAILPSPTGARRVDPDEGAAFIVACWYSLALPNGSWAALTDTDGHRLRRSDGMAAVDTLTRPQGPTLRAREVVDPDIVRIEGYCRNRIPADVRDTVRLEVAVRGRSVTIVERRAPWSPGIGPEWSSKPIAQLRRHATDGSWALFWPESSGRWHRDSATPTTTIDTLLRRITEDPQNHYWG